MAGATSIDLAWDVPEGGTVVDHYLISLSPPPPSQAMDIMVPVPLLSIVLNTSIATYTTSVTAVNCNGNSPAITLDIDLSKCMLQRNTAELLSI